MVKNLANAKPKTNASQKTEDAKQRLQATLDRACGAVHDSPTSSVARRIVQAAKHGVPRETAEAAIAALDGAVADLRTTTEQAYVAGSNRTSRVSRVTL